MSTLTIVDNTSRQTLTVLESGSTATIGTTEVTFNGSDMTGSDGDTGRSYTYAGSFNNNALVFIGSANQGTQLLPSSKYSFSTSVVTRDTITFSIEVYDQDLVIVRT